MKRIPGREKAIELAVGGMSARDICGYFEDKIAISTISQWMTDARRRGAKIKYQSRAPIQRMRPHAPRPGFVSEKAKPKPKPAHQPLTSEEEARLADLAKRNIGLTAIAAQMRRPYGMLAEAMNRMGLSRAGDVSISTRAG